MLVAAAVGCLVTVASFPTNAGPIPGPTVPPIHYSDPNVDNLPGWYRGSNVCQGCRSPVPFYNGVAYSDAFWVNDGQNIAYALREPANPNTNDTFRNTGIPTTSADGVGVRLTDRDLAGREGGSGGPVDSDYIYAFGGTIWFSSDSENFLVGTDGNNINPALLFPIQETGLWQDVSGYFGSPVNGGFYPNGSIFVASDVPEPAGAALLGLGLSLLGFARRKRR